MAVAYSLGCGCSIYEQNCMEEGKLTPLDLDLMNYHSFYGSRRSRLCREELILLDNRRSYFTSYCRQLKLLLEK
jgi:hypothetical protein